jgi:hypothetical protein
MSRNNRNYNNQKGKQQSIDGRKKPSASGNIGYDELFPPLSTPSTVPMVNNTASSVQVNIYNLFSTKFVSFYLLRINQQCRLNMNNNNNNSSSSRPLHRAVYNFFNI